MSTLLRSRNIAGATLALVALTGCGPGGLAGDGENESPPSPQKKALASVDPCTILKRDVAEKFGFENEGQPNDIVKSSPGCDYSGEPWGMTVVTIKDKSIDDLAGQDNWASFDRVQVNGRSGATAIDASATQAGICSTMFDSAGGVISIDLGENRDKGLDECAESKKIAEAIEPNTPK